MCFRLKKYPIINFAKGMWGMDWYVNKDSIKGRKARVYGWVPWSIQKSLKKGTLILKELDNSFLVCRIKKIEWMDDPTDMFFADVVFCSEAKHLSKYECDFLIRYIPHFKEDDFNATS